MSKKKPYIVISAGGTGGHLFPAISVAQELVSNGWDIEFVTDIRGAKYLSGYKDFNIKIIAANSPFVGNVLRRIAAIFKIIFSVLSLSMKYIFRRPKFIQGFGGYVTTAPFLVAIILRIPFAIHEQNIIMGRVNKLFSPFANLVASSFPTNYINVKNKNFVQTGLPIRSDIIKSYDEQKSLEKDINQNQDNIKNKKINVLIIGGSQGASFFSKIMPQLFSELSKQHKFSVCHQAPEKDMEHLKEQYKNDNIEAEVNYFFNDVGQRYIWADLIISRAGASSVIETGLFNKNIIFIPLPYAMDDHQKGNASFLADKGIAKIIDEPHPQKNSKTDEEFLDEIVKVSQEFINNNLLSNEKSDEFIKYCQSSPEENGIMLNADKNLTVLIENIIS